MQQATQSNRSAIPETLNDLTFPQRHGRAAWPSPLDRCGSSEANTKGDHAMSISRFDPSSTGARRKECLVCGEPYTGGFACPLPHFLEELLLAPIPSHEFSGTSPE